MQGWDDEDTESELMPFSSGRPMGGAPGPGEAAEEAAEAGGGGSPWGAVIGALSQLASGIGRSRSQKVQAQQAAEAQARARRQAALSAAMGRGAGGGGPGFAPTGGATPRY